MIYEDMICVITGGANGIGKALVQGYCEKGSTVVFLDHDFIRGSELEFKLRALKYKCTYMQVDLSDGKKVQETISFIYKMFGRINLIINNVGIFSNKSIYETTLHEFTSLIQTNLLSVFATSQMFAKCRKENNHQHLLGRIINMSSTRYLMSEPNTEAYAASKGGISSITHSLAVTLSDINVQVNAIAPGWICNQNYDELSLQDHIQHPSNRVGKPKDIVNACFYLSDSENDFINGQTIVIDGGMTKKMIYVE